MIQAISWNNAYKYFNSNCKQSEYFATIGMNGSGKSYLTANLVQMIYKKNSYVCVFNSKPKDKTLEKYEQIMKFKRVTNIARHNFEIEPRGIVIKPSTDNLNSLKAMQAEKFELAINKIWKCGYWTIVFDEIRYLTQFLGLQELIAIFYTQARSSDISIYAGTQRPRFAPLEMYSESRHFAFFHDREEANLKRLSEMASHIDKNLLKTTIQNLEKYEFVYVNSDNGDCFISKVG